MRTLTILVFLSSLNPMLSTCRAQGSAFTYQGRLNDGAAPANGNYDLRFTLYDAGSSGAQIGVAITQAATAVSNGLFTVALDFGSVFDGNARWLEIGVRTNSSGSGFVTLSPRQALTAAPYALYAMTPAGPMGPEGPQGPAGPNGATGATGPQGPVGATGPQGLTGPAGAVGPIGPQGAVGVNWRGTWTAAASYPTNDAVAYSGTSWLAKQSNSNTPPVEGADWTTLAQKGDTGATGPQGAVGPQGPVGATGPQGSAGPVGATGPQGPQGAQGLPGSADAWSRTGNAGTDPANNFLGTTDLRPFEVRVNDVRVLRLEPSWDPNFTSFSPNLIGGYSGNLVSNGVYGAFIAGGGNSAEPNFVGGNYAAVVGGSANIATGDNSVAMGKLSIARGPNSTAMGWSSEASGLNATAMGEATAALGRTSTAVGYRTTATGDMSTAMGHSTTATGHMSTAVGYRTTSSGDMSTAMGDSTTARGSVSTAMGRGSIAGGLVSTAIGEWTYAAGDYSLAAGYHARAMHRGAFVWSDYSSEIPLTSTADNQFCVRAAGGTRFTGPLELGAEIPGKQIDAGKIGYQLFSGDALDIVGAGTSDTNRKITLWSEGGANLNGPLWFGSSLRQMLNLYASAYGIGVQDYSMYFRCDGNYSQNGFLWYKGGQHANGYADPGGGVELMHLTDGGLWVNGTFVNRSDRNAKENFSPVDTRAVLDKVASLPLSQWNYRNDSATRHMGPMAQDFYAAFGVGPDDKHIATVDADGVALAAIQGLNEKLEVRSANSEGRFHQLEAENAELKQRLGKLEQLLNQRSGSAK
ncbi:MAG TPA: tail fiber domain-containing protein [Verrucomicrobiae bacterium]